MVRVPDSRLVGPGFESRQVGGSVLIQPPCRNLDNFTRPISPAPSNPHWSAWKGRPCNNTSMQSTTKPWPPVPNGTERVQGQGGGSGQLGLRAKNLLVKKSRRKRVSRLKISRATYIVRTLLRDEHMNTRTLERT